MHENIKKNIIFVSITLGLGVAAPAAAQDLGALGEAIEADVNDAVGEATGGIEVVEGAGDARGEVVLGQDASQAKAPPVKGKVGYTGREKKLKKTSKAYICTTSKGFKVNKKLVSGETGITMQGSCAISIKNSIIRSSEHNLLVQGSGKIKVKNTTLRSEGVGIAIQGSGTVILTDVDLEADVAILIQGSGDVIVRNSRIKGEIVRQGKGKVVYEEK